MTTDLETAARAALEAMKAVVAGDIGPSRARRDQTCAHGRYYWEDCGQCVDEHLAPAIAALEAALTAPVGPPSPPPEWLMRVAYAAREFCEDWKKGDFSLSTLAALDAQSIVEAFEKPMDPSTRDAYAIRRAALMDAVAECHIGPSDEWSDGTKSGYIAAADDCQRRIRRLADKEPAAAPGDLAAIEPVIRADERERCARVVDEYVEANKDYATVHYSALPAIAREIRNRKTTP